MLFHLKKCNYKLDMIQLSLCTMHVRTYVRTYVRMYVCIYLSI